jgi:predicted MPP superfamily phosphohydrolase
MLAGVMWLAILIGGLILVVVHAIYFSRRMCRALAAVAPATERFHRLARRLYLVVACSLPASMLALMLYVALGRPERIGLPTSPLFSYLVELPFWLVTVYSFQVTLIVLPLDLVHRGLLRLGIAAGDAWLRRRHILALAIAAGFLVYVPLRLVLDHRALEVRQHEVVIAGLPPALDGLVIALVADLQADEYTDEARLAQLVDAVNQRAPDLIIMAGDLVTRDPAYLELGARMAGGLHARLGTLACIGDHDNFLYRDRTRSLREVVAALDRHGVAMLDDQVRTLAVGDATIAVILATNNYLSRIAPATTAALLDQARGADLRILCAHQTSAALLAAARAGGVDLVLAGHTHGGQVRFWLPLFDLSPARFETPYVSGAFRLGTTTLVVTSGLGMSVAPLRYRAPATVDLVRLRRGPYRPRAHSGRSATSPARAASTAARMAARSRGRVPASGR